MLRKLITAYAAKTAVALIMLPGVAIAAAPPASNETLASYMHGWHQAVDECRGSYPDDSAHTHWCQLADSYDAKLKAQRCRLVALGTSIGSLRWSCPNSTFGDTGN